MTTSQTPRSRGRLLLIHWVPTILFNVVLPLITYNLLTDRQVSAVTALLISGGWPVIELALSFAVRRRFDEFGVLTLIFIALGVIAGLGLHSARLVLIKESAVTGLFGVVALASLVLPRPMMFYFGRKFATDGSTESVARWNGLWQHPSFRRTQRIITVVWGVAFVAEAATRIGLSYALSTSAMTAVSAVLPLVVVAALLFWTISYGRRARAAAVAKYGPAARTDAPPPAAASPVRP
ncbi:VC0807 family protein [Actinoplanes sp. NPDC051513]|uniref:VC0807 family protein n=1 Tax=Actinoplanes sp. NPDC051513 TaxID=3363908 RepID=UPI003792F0D5